LEAKILETKVGRILDFDKSIWSVVMLSSDGRAMASFQRRGTAPLEPESETETVYMKATIAVSMSTPMDKYHGRVRSAVIVKEKVTMICFNMMGKIMLIMASPAFQLQRVEELGQLIDQLGIG
jgi:hypothetical protein